MYINLGCGEANSWRFVHRLGHVTGQAANAVVNFFNRRGDGFQARIREAEDR